MGVCMDDTLHKVGVRPLRINTEIELDSRLPLPVASLPLTMSLNNSTEQQALDDLYKELGPDKRYEIGIAYSSVGGAVILGKLEDSWRICSAAGGGALSLDVSSVANVSAYFCGILDGAVDAAAGDLANSSSSIAGFYQNYLHTDVATGPFKLISYHAAASRQAASQQAASSQAAVSQGATPQSSGRRSALGSWWWVPLAGAIAAAVVV